MSVQELDILKSWKRGTTIREINWDDIRVPLIKWADTIVKDMNQLRIDLLGSNYPYNNNSVINLANCIVQWDTFISVLDWIFSGDVTFTGANTYSNANTFAAGKLKIGGASTGVASLQNANTSSDRTMTIYADGSNPYLVAGDDLALHQQTFNWENLQKIFFERIIAIITKATMGGVVADTYMQSMAVYNGKLYIGTFNAALATDSTAAKVLCFDGSTWSVITKATMGGVNADRDIQSMAIYNDKLYMGTTNITAATNSTAAKLLVFDGSAWSVITKATMGGVGADIIIQSMVVYNDKLYIGTYNVTAATNSTAAKLLVFDGSTWSVITKATMGGVNADIVMQSMAIYNGKLYIGTQNTTLATTSTAAKLLVFDGSTWSVITKDTMDGVTTDIYMQSMAVYGSKLYIGTHNVTAATDNTAAKILTLQIPICECLNSYTSRGF